MKHLMLEQCVKFGAYLIYFQSFNFQKSYANVCIYVDMVIIIDVNFTQTENVRTYLTHIFTYKISNPEENFHLIHNDSNDKYMVFIIVGPMLI